MERGVTFDAKLRRGGNSLALIVPHTVLQTHGLKQGESVNVPFHEWVVLKSR